MKTIYILRHSIPDKTKYKKTPNELEKNKSIEIKEILIIYKKRIIQ